MGIQCEWMESGDRFHEPCYFYAFFENGICQRILRQDGMEVRAYEVPMTAEALERANRILYAMYGVCSDVDESSTTPAESEAPSRLFTTSSAAQPVLKHQIIPAFEMRSFPRRHSRIREAPYRFYRPP